MRGHPWHSEIVADLDPAGPEVVRVAPGAGTHRRTLSSSWSNSLTASASAVRPSANSVVTGFVDSLAACRKLVPAVAAQLAALLMGGDCIGVHRHQATG